MKLKKLIALSLTAILGLSLTACGSDKKTEDNGNKTKIVVGASPVPLKVVRVKSYRERLYTDYERNKKNRSKKPNYLTEVVAIK